MYLTRSMAREHQRANVAIKAEMSKRLKAMPRAAPAPATAKLRWPLDHVHGDGYANLVLRRARAARGTAFATPKAEARWAYRALADELAQIYKRGRACGWDDETVIRKVDVQVKMSVLVQQYPGAGR